MQYFELCTLSAAWDTQDARSGTPNSDMMPSPYEQQRLDNIARNQKILESLGLG